MTPRKPRPAGRGQHGLLRKERKQPSSKPNPKNAARFRWKKAWAWPKPIEDKIRSLVEGYSLHVCSGGSTLGDVKVDLHEAATVRGDMFHLPIRPSTFDTVVCDPPWNLPYHVRHKLHFQVRDVLRPGGLLIWNALWPPKIRGLELELEMYVGVPSMPFRNASFLWLARRSSLC